MSTAGRLIDYIEGLELAGGDHDGELIRLLPWERRFLRGVFGKGKVGDAGLSVARGNGKSTVVGAIACAVVDPAGPLHRRRGEVTITASSFAQAKIIYEDCRAFMADQLRDRRTWRVQDSQNVATIEHRETGSRIRCLGSDPRRLHGIRPLIVLADEPSQWESTKADKAHAALRTSLGKVEGSRLIALGTRPAGESHWFAKLLRSARNSQVHAAGKDDNPFSVRTWRRANPSLDHLPSLRAAIEAEAEDAKRDPSLLPSLRALRFNLGVEDVAISVLVTAEAWQRCEVDMLPAASGPMVLAFDLSGGDAMAAAAAYWPRCGRLEATAAFPPVPGLQERAQQDQADYEGMHHDGDLLILGEPDERVVPVDLLLRAALTRWGRPTRIIADYHQQRELQTALDRARFPLTSLVTTGMGWRDGPGRIRDFRRAVGGGRVWVQSRLLIRQALANSRTIADSNADEKIIKGGASGRARTARDDVAVAVLLCVSEGVTLGSAATRRRWALAG